MKRYSLPLFITALLLLMGCSKKTQLSPDSVLRTAYQTDEPTSLDYWIEEHLTKPYNISVEYRWQKNSSQKDSYSYPPMEEKVLPILQVLHKLAIEPFAELFEHNALFRKAFPIRIYLYGEKNIHPIGIELIRNSDATPLEMHLYGVNDFDTKKEEALFALCRSIYHQFALRLTEVVPYDYEAFLALSKGRHMGSIGFVRPFLSELRKREDLFGYSGYSLREGFFTLYSAISPRDEMAEILSIFFASTPDEHIKAYERANSYQTDPNDPSYGERNKKAAEEAVAILKSKEQFVAHYLTDEVKVPLIRIQRRLHNARSEFKTAPSALPNKKGDAL